MILYRYCNFYSEKRTFYILWLVSYQVHTNVEKARTKLKKAAAWWVDGNLSLLSPCLLSTFSWSLTFQSLCNNTSASCCCMFFTFGNAQGSFICFFLSPPVLPSVLFPLPALIGQMSSIRLKLLWLSSFHCHYWSSFNYLQKATQCFNINLLCIWELLYILDCRAESRPSTAGWMYPHRCNLLLEHPLNYQIKASGNVPSILEL